MKGYRGHICPPTNQAEKEIVTGDKLLQELLAIACPNTQKIGKALCADMRRPFFIFFRQSNGNLLATFFGQGLSFLLSRALATMCQKPRRGRMLDPKAIPWIPHSPCHPEKGYTLQSPEDPPEIATPRYSPEPSSRSRGGPNRAQGIRSTPSVDADAGAAPLLFGNSLVLDVFGFFGFVLRA